MKQKKRTICAVSVLCVTALLIILPIMASAGTAANSLEVRVGYFGGPYYTKETFSEGQMDSMATIKKTYSFIDNMPAAGIDCARGVYLRTLMDKSGISTNTIDRFFFFTSDSGGEHYVGEYTKSKLLGATRYYYPNLIYNYTTGKNLEGDALENASKEAVSVESMIAVADKWQRDTPGGASPIEDYTGLVKTERYRLLFGQLSPKESAAFESARWIHSIVVVLGGPDPTLTVDTSDLELKVGSKQKINVTVNADDAVKDLIKKDIKWSSSDESIAVVDANGNVTFKKEGKVTITASYTTGGEDGTAKKTIKSKASLSASKEKSEKTDPKDKENSGAGGGSQNGGDSNGTGGSDGSGTKTIALKKGKITADSKALKKNLEKKAKKTGNKSDSKKWQVYEMSQTEIATAKERPETNTKEDYYGGIFAGMITGTVFFLGIAGRIWIFYKQL